MYQLEKKNGPREFQKGRDARASILSKRRKERHAGGFPWSSWFEYLQSAETRKAHASGVISSELFGAACDRGALEAPDMTEGKFVEFHGPVSKGVDIGV